MKKINSFSTSSNPLELWQGQSLDLLKALHIITLDGKINADSRRKLKQVYHLTQFFEPHIQNLYAKHKNLHIVDMGAGKSYLGFILYDLILRNLEASYLTSVEYRPELCEKSRALAKKASFERMNFIASSIQEAHKPLLESPQARPVHAVVALHACDTATDDALQFGLKAQAELIALVPCCQASLARHLEKLKANHEPWLSFEMFWKHGIHRREFGSLATNLLRILTLESEGYAVTTTEFVGFEHSFKNELMMATRNENLGVHATAAKERAKQQLEILKSALNL